jgi:hypothetical protein
MPAAANAQIGISLGSLDVGILISSSSSSRNRGPRLALPSVSCQALCVWVLLELSFALLVSGDELRATTEGLGRGGGGLFDTGRDSFTCSYLQRLP